MRPTYVILSTALVILSLSALAAEASDFAAVEYECAQTKASADGLRCRVVNIDGMGATLLIYIHSKVSSPAAAQAHTKYMLRRTMSLHLAAGGRFIIQRVRDPKGKIVERTCSRGKGRLQEQCQNWDKPDPDASLDALFAPLVQVND